MDATPMPRPRTFAAAGMAAALVLAVVALVRPAVAPGRATASPSQTAQASATPTLSQTEVAIRNVLATKAVRRATDEAWSLARVTLPPYTRSGPPTPDPNATPEPTAFAPYPYATPAGAGWMTERLTDPYGDRSHVTDNGWYVDSEGGTRRTCVYAGAMIEPGGKTTNQGVVVVRVFQLVWRAGHRETDMVDADYCPTPLRVGSVRIVDAVGERLILQAEDGTTFYFDVPERCYASSLTEVVPTATRRPTRTPTATLIPRPTPRPLPSYIPGRGTPYP